MFSDMFRGLFDSDITKVIGVEDFLLCIGVSLLLGVVMALAYSFRSRFSKSFVVALATLPAVVCVVILMVNGNIGAGVAVAGAFSLVRFRSAPGTAKDICALFMAMGAGLVMGMGYIGYAALFTAVMCAVFLLYNTVSAKLKTPEDRYKSLRVTIPEDLDYTEVFDDILKKYTSSFELVKVKTVNMGSMFRLSYDVVLKNGVSEKAMIDDIRCRNGNLEISVSHRENGTAEL